MFEKTTKTVSYILGWPLIKGLAVWIGQQVGQLGQATEPKTTGTFEEIFTAKGLSEADLAHHRKSAKHLFYLCLSLVIVFTTISMIMLKNSGDLGPLGMLVIVPFLLALSFKNAFGNWQVRRRISGGLRLFLSTPGEWLPR